jgi:hypothetical protein
MRLSLLSPAVVLRTLATKAAHSGFVALRFFLFGFLPGPSSHIGDALDEHALGFTLFGMDAEQQWLHHLRETGTGKNSDFRLTMLSSR